MKIDALTTGAGRVKHPFLYPRPGRRRQLGLFLPGPFSDPLPIHRSAIEHAGVLRLVDTGETATARNVPFASHPTIYLPSHDPDSARRFADATTSSEILAAAA